MLNVTSFKQSLTFLNIKSDNAPFKRGALSLSSFENKSSVTK